MAARPTQRDLDGMRDEIVRAFDAAGHPIRASVRVDVRRDLRPTATTFRDADGFVILVSERALDGGGVALLLAHELGHVQRMDAEHPSHDDDAITAAYASVPPAAREHEWQRAILHHAINMTQDLYADPLSFKVARALGLVAPAQIDALLKGFLNDEPYLVEDARERRWDQTEDMVGNARAIALARLAGAPEAAARGVEAQRRYLAKLPPDLAREAPWFQARFEHLPEDVTRDGFAALLVEYVGRFVGAAEGQRTERG